MIKFQKLSHRIFWKHAIPYWQRESLTWSWYRSLLSISCQNWPSSTSVHKASEQRRRQLDKREPCSWYEKSSGIVTIPGKNGEKIDAFVEDVRFAITEEELAVKNQEATDVLDNSLGNTVNYLADDKKCYWSSQLYTLRQWINWNYTQYQRRGQDWIILASRWSILPWDYRIICLKFEQVWCHLWRRRYRNLDMAKEICWSLQSSQMSIANILDILT